MQPIIMPPTDIAIMRYYNQYSDSLFQITIRANGRSGFLSTTELNTSGTIYINWILPGIMRYATPRHRAPAINTA